MPTVSVVFGVVLTALGLMAYFNPEPLGVGKDGKPAEPGHPTSLAPVAVGAVLILAGAASMVKPSARKHAMHLAAVAALLGTVGGIVPVALRGGNFAEVAVKVGLGMAVLSAVVLALCVSSFVRARRARSVRERSSSSPRL